MTNAPIDVVYTWVDDSFPGYLDLLNRYSSDRRDLNPNRTRDNLDLIRFSMRSVAKHMPDVRQIYLFTCRPQIPAWLDETHPKIRIVHHDEVMDSAYLPTFSSFAIVSHLHHLPDLSDTFLYLEDDILLNSDAALSGLVTVDGRPIVNLGRHRILPKSKLNPDTSSPWNLALAHADRELSKHFGPGPRRQTIHGPQMFNRAAMSACEDTFVEAFTATRKSRFRSEKAIPPEMLVPHFMVETGAADRADLRVARKMEGYASLENFAPWSWAQLKMLDIRQPLSVTLNDSFEDQPNPKVEAMARRWLAAKFPDPAPWERSGFS